LYGSTVGPKRTFAPVVGLFGGRQELASRSRSAVSPIYDARKPLDRIRDHIASARVVNIGVIHALQASCCLWGKSWGEI
jgi:hypothetical protein